MITQLQIRPFDRADETVVVKLWEVCGLTRPWNDPRRDIERKLSVDDGLFWVGAIGYKDHENEDDNMVVATIMGGYEGHRGWVNYLAVHPDWQGTGFGRQLMAKMEKRLCAAGCPKINLQVRTDNIELVKFYEAIGYTVDDVVSLGKRLIHDDK